MAGLTPADKPIRNWMFFEVGSLIPANINTGKTKKMIPRLGKNTENLIAALH